MLLARTLRWSLLVTTACHIVVRSQAHRAISRLPIATFRVSASPIGAARWAYLRSGAACNCRLFRFRIFAFGSLHGRLGRAFLRLVRGARSYETLHGPGRSVEARGCGFAARRSERSADGYRARREKESASSSASYPRRDTALGAIERIHEPRVRFCIANANAG